MVMYEHAVRVRVLSEFFTVPRFFACNHFPGQGELAFFDERTQDCRAHDAEQRYRHQPPHMPDDAKASQESAEGNDKTNAAVLRQTNVVIWSFYAHAALLH